MEKVKKEKLFTRNIGLLVAGLGISGIGSMLFQFSLTFWVLDLTGSALMVSGILTAAVIGRLIFNPIASNVVSVLKKKWIIVITDLCMFGLWGFAWFMFSQDNIEFDDLYLTMAVVSFLTSMLGCFNGLASETLLRNMTKKSVLHKLYAFLGFLDSFKAMGVMALSGVVYITLGMNFIILFNAATFLLAVVMEIMIRFDEKPSKGKIILNPLKHYWVFIKGVKYLRKQKEVWSLFKLTALMLLVSPAIWSIGNKYFLLEVSQMSESEYSLLMSIGTAIALIGPVIVYKLSRNKVMSLSRYLYLFIIVPTALIKASMVIFKVEGLFSMLPLVSIWFGAHFLMRPTGQITAISRHTAMNITVDDRDVVRLKGTSNFLGELFALITFPIAGYIIDNFSITYLYIVDAGWAIVIGILYFTNKTLVNASKRLKEEKISKRKQNENVTKDFID